MVIDPQRVTDIIRETAQLDVLPRHRLAHVACLALVEAGPVIRRGEEHAVDGRALLAGSHAAQAQGTELGGARLNAQTSVPAAGRAGSLSPSM